MVNLSEIDGLRLSFWNTGCGGIAALAIQLSLIGVVESIIKTLRMDSYLKAISFKNLERLQRAARLKNDAHTEAFQQARDENDAELTNIQAIFQDAFELKYIESYDLGYIIGFVGCDHQDGWDAYNKMAKIKKANFLIPPSMSNEIVELEVSKRTRLSDDFDDGSRSDTTCQLQSCSQPSICY
ncbi:hypothetical protein C1H46_034732 [Malus baccata]|uniref:Uncharacterized protein n=1 Tax=Malus baccata TaxID=106549 RepID=A0A540KZQ1_MALBA|nr:hypothetical protein C1H46_034732 [Malus baccata]